MWAYRGYDGSSGVPDPTTLVDDAVDAYSELVREQHVAPDRVHLVGFSLGTAVAAALYGDGRSNQRCHFDARAGRLQFPAPPL